MALRPAVAAMSPVCGGGVRRRGRSGSGAAVWLSGGGGAGAASAGWSGLRPGDYLFFLDVEGHRSDPRLVRALAAAARVAHTQRVLGSFPRAEAPRAARSGQGG